MNNLKRVLSLLLAVVMIVGCMAIASAAALTDEAEIEHKEAVETMVALNIINGKPNGDGTNKFDPDATVTRAEVAKMIFVALNGGRDNPNLTKLATPTYTDIKGNWAEGYIEYVSALKIIAGKGDGTFNPSGEVTAQELSKMLLVAIGYDPAEEGLQGTADWGVNADSLAFAAGFYDNVSLASTSAALSRENAAQIIYDAINAQMVKYDYKITSENGTVVTKAIRVDDNDNGTLVTAKYGLAREAASVLKKVDLITTGVNKGTYTLTLTNNEVYTKVAEDYTSLLGQQVRILTDNYNNDKVYGVYATDVNTVVEKNFNTLTNKANATGSKVTATITDNVYDAAGTIVPDYTSLNTVKLIDNTGDGEYNMAVITSYTAAQVTYKSSTEIIAGGTTYKYASATIGDDVAKDDYVAIHKDLSTNKTVVEKITVATAAIAGKKAATATAAIQYQLDGTWYASANADLAAGTTEYTYCTLNGVLVSAVAKDAVTLENVVLLVKYQTGITNQAKVMYLDGTEEILNLSSANGEAVGEGNEGKLFTVKSTSAGYVLTLVDGNIGTYTWVAGGDNFDDGADTVADVEIADSAVVFVFDGNAGKEQAKVYTGAQAKNFEIDAEYGVTGTTNGAFTSKVNNLTRVSVAVMNVKNATKLPKAIDKSANYGLVVAKAYQVAGGTCYDVWTGTETVTVTDKDNKIEPVAGDVIVYTSIAEGAIKGAIILNEETEGTYGNPVNGYIVSISGNNLYVNGETEGDKVKKTSDTVVFYYDSAEMEGKTEGTIVAADTVGDAFIQNIRYIADTNDELTFLLVDVKNKLDSADTYSVYLLGNDADLAVVSPKIADDDDAAIPQAAGTILTVTVGDDVYTITNDTVVLGDGLQFVDTSALGGNATDGYTISVTAGNTKAFTVVVLNNAGDDEYTITIDNGE